MEVEINVFSFFFLIYEHSFFLFLSLPIAAGGTSVSSVGQFSVCPLIPPSSFTTLSPANNAQNVSFVSITFNWTASTHQVNNNNNTDNNIIIIIIIII
jgi:hypothetical protein